MYAMEDVEKSIWELQGQIGTDKYWIGKTGSKVRIRKSSSGQ